MEQQKTLFLESCLRWLAVKAQEFKIPLLSSFLFGLLAYTFNFTNKLINHDEVQCLFSKGAALSSGRWGLNILERVFPNVSMPFLYGIFSLTFIAISVCIIVHIFKIKNHLLQVLLAGSIVVFPSLIGTFAYMFTSCSFALSFLMAVLAVWLIQKTAKFTAVPALCCMVFSLGIYQSYISIAAGLLVLILIQQLLLDEDVKIVLRRGFFFLGFLVVSLVAYYAATLLLQRILNVSFNGYASSNISFSLADIPGKIIIAYGNFFRFLQGGYPGLVSTPLSHVMHCIVLASIICLFILIAAQKRHNFARLFLLIALTIILPLAINCMYLFTTEDSIHTLVLYGFVLLYIFSVILADTTLKIGDPAALFHRISKELLSMAMAVIIICNIYIANEASLNLYLRYENAYAFYTSLIADIKMTPEFNENTRLAIVGEYHGPDFYYENFFDVMNLAGTNGFLPTDYSKNAFVEYYLGFPIPFASYEECQAIAETAEYADMAVYPYYGSMKFFGDVLVVKLS